MAWNWLGRNEQIKHLLLPWILISYLILQCEILKQWYLYWSYSSVQITIPESCTAWKVSKYGVFPSLYFSAFGLNTERYSVSLRIQSERGKIRTRINSKFGHFWRSVCQMHRLKICGGFRFLSKVRSICGHLSVSNFPGVLLINYVKDGLIKWNG